MVEQYQDKNPPTFRNENNLLSENLNQFVEMNRGTQFTVIKNNYRTYKEKLNLVINGKSVLHIKRQVH